MRPRTPRASGDAAPASRARLARGDVLLTLGLTALVAAAAYPRAERARAGKQAQAAGDAVEVLRAAVVALREAEGAWPEGAPSGVVPPSLQARLPAGFSFSHGRYRLQWTRWEAVRASDAITSSAADGADPSPDTLSFPSLTDRVGAERGFPPDLALPGLQGPRRATEGDDTVPDPEALISTLGAITVSSGDERILAALLERFGGSRSFVLDSAWTLVLADGGRE